MGRETTLATTDGGGQPIRRTTSRGAKSLVFGPVRLGSCESPMPTSTATLVGGREVLCRTLGATTTLA